MLNCSHLNKRFFTCFQKMRHLGLNKKTKSTWWNADFHSVDLTAQFWHFKILTGFVFPQNLEEWCISLQHWSFVRSCHVFIISVSLHLWFLFSFDRIWGKWSHCCIPVLGITLIGPLGNYNYSSKQGAIFVTDWPRRGLHHSWGMTCLLLPWSLNHIAPQTMKTLLVIKNSLFWGSYRFCFHLWLQEVTVDMSNFSIPCFFLTTAGSS